MLRSSLMKIKPVRLVEISSNVSSLNLCLLSLHYILPELHKLPLSGTMTFVLPGDAIPASASSSTFGPGIGPLPSAGPSRPKPNGTPVKMESDGDGSSVVVTKAGHLMSQDTKGKGKGVGMWIEGSSKRVCLSVEIKDPSD